MSSAPSRRALGVVVAGALVTFVALGLTVRARRNRASWWTRAERICACGDATRRSLGRLSQEAVGGLAEVSAAQRALLQADCDDLRVAVSRRSWPDEVSRRPLRVIATDQHHERASAVTHALGAMCGGSHDEFWQRLALDLAVHADDPPAAELSRVRATARGHLAIRQAMCADRVRLSVVPRSYVLSVTDAEQQASACQRELATRTR